MCRWVGDSHAVCECGPRKILLFLPPLSLFFTFFSNTSPFSLSPFLTPFPSLPISLHFPLLIHLPNSAQAFHDAFSDFIAWLRDTERKIQRDDPLKLEVAELKTGLTYLQVRVTCILNMCPRGLHPSLYHWQY